MEKLKWHTEKRIINQLIPYENNPRIMTEKQKNDLQKSLNKFDLVEIPAIDVDNKIIAGHQRLKILQLLGRGEEEIDVRIPNRKLTDEEFREYNLRSNKNMGDWDWDLLVNYNEEFLLDVGFSEKELSDKFNIETKEDNFDVNKVIGEIKEPICKLGDIWQLGKHKLMCGDSTDKKDIKKLIGNELIDLCLTDPPYNLGYKYNAYNDNKSPEEYKNWCNLWFNNIKEISEQILITCGLQNLSMWFEIEKPRWILCWLKRNSQSGCTLRGFNRHEPIILYGKYEPILFWGYVKKIIPEDIYDVEDKKSDVYDIKTAYYEDSNDGMRELHSCPKPIKLFAKIIKDFTSPGNTILDIFIGSGTSLIASERIHRICYGMEIDSMYCDVIIKRWETYTGQKAVKINE